MPLSAADIIQENAGVAATSPFTVDFGEGGVPTTPGRQLIIIVSENSIVTTPDGFVRDHRQLNNNDHVVLRKRIVGGSETSWQVTTNPAGHRAAWYVAEHRGLDFDDPIAVPPASTGSSAGVSERSTGVAQETEDADVAVIASFGTSVGGGGTNSVTTIRDEADATDTYQKRADVCTALPSGTNLGLAVATRYPGATGAFEAEAVFAGVSQSTAILMVYKAATAGAEQTITLGSVAAPLTAQPLEVTIEAGPQTAELGSVPAPLTARPVAPTAGPITVQLGSATAGPLTACPVLPAAGTAAAQLAAAAAVLTARPLTVSQTAPPVAPARTGTTVLDTPRTGVTSAL